MQGKVKWFNAQKGYGFVVGEDGKDYFAHQTAILMDGFRQLSPDDAVEFEVVEDPKGPRAANVKRLESVAN